MNNQAEWDLTDYNSQIDAEQRAEEQQIFIDFILNEDSCFHPLAQKSQPYDWCQALQITN